VEGLAANRMPQDPSVIRAAAKFFVRLADFALAMCFNLMVCSVRLACVSIAGTVRWSRIDLRRSLPKRL
jgi:hypothetical protein